MSMPRDPAPALRAAQSPLQLPDKTWLAAKRHERLAPHHEMNHD